MSDIKEQSIKPGQSKSRWKFVVVGLLIVTAIVMVWRGRKVDDAALERALAGTWTAVDPGNMAFHRRELPVAREQLIFQSNGKLTQVIELASEPGKPDNDPWDWKVHNSRLYVRFMGDDASGQWLPGFPFSVSGNNLSIRVKGYPPKEWVRR